MPDDELKTITVTPRYQEGTLTDGVVVPFLQAGITALILSFLALVVSIRAGLAFWDCVFAFCLTLCISLLITWLLFRYTWMGIIERVLGLDINGDGQIGPPAPDYPEITVNLTHNQGSTYQARRVKLPFADRLPTLARGLMNGLPFTQREWVGKGRGKLFSRPEWETLTSAMEAEGLAEKINPAVKNSELQPTAAGRKALMEIAMLASGGVQIYQPPAAMNVNAHDEPLYPPPPPWYGGGA